MSPPQRSEPFSAGYYSELVGSARVRYEEKVRMCDGMDPYTLRPGVDTTMDVNVFPEVTHGDIVNYLVYSSSFVTREEMKAFISMEAHNYFTSGWVRSLSAMRLQDEKVLLLGEVNHSQRLSDHPLKAWILCKADGSVLAAHCTCMASTGETCSHVGACLFAVETAVRIRNSVSCTQKNNIWLPAYVEKVQFKRLRDIDFTSSRGRKQKIDGTRAEGQQKKKRLEIPSPSPQELKELYDGIAKDGSIVPALFSVHKDRYDVFQEPLQKPAAHLRNLFRDDALGDSYEVVSNSASM
ncbi:uncharacterized protein LOC125945767 [Dermacentor silvarum]|uniref:uncharacterized protein LOC125945767 n=1 Tax=Dermacentor silvarum TaxID=543639 RepID=UPI0021019A5C|nr:uncharacterized protein LOC125945767 [Dermacentor silvarum]